MAKSAEDFNKRRLRSSNITVVISIALVLFLVGLCGLILINAQKYSDYLKEQLVVNAYFDQNYDAADSVNTLKREMAAVEKIKTLPSVNKATYISREQASIEAKKAMGVDGEALFDAHIFPSSVEVALKPEYVNPQKVNTAIAEIKSVPGIQEVKNDSESQQIYDKLNRILKWILGFSLIFLLVAIVLINNSIRLKIFSKRFIIKTMQLVGAKRGFILKPFMKEAVILGLLGALIAILALSAVWYYFSSTVNMPFVQDNQQYIWLLVIILATALIITVLSTIIATWRFLRSNIDDLYYS